MIEHDGFQDCLALDSSGFFVAILKTKKNEDIPCLDRISLSTSETQMVNGASVYKEMIVQLRNKPFRLCVIRTNIPTPVRFRRRLSKYQESAESTYYIQNINSGTESNPCGSDSDFPDGTKLLMQNYFVPQELRSGSDDQHTTIHMTNGEEGIQLVTEEAEGNMLAAQSSSIPFVLENINPGEENASRHRGVSGVPFYNFIT
jgi:hypothetical protein